MSTVVTASVPRRSLERDSHRSGSICSLRAGTHLELDEVHSTRGRSVTVTGEPVRVDADGELGDTVVSRTWTLADGLVPVLVPA